MAKRQIDFLGQRHIAIFCSLLLVAFSVYQWISKGSAKYGIDFVGGIEVVVRVLEDKSAQDLTTIVAASGLNSVSVQSFEFLSKEFSIKVGEQEGLDHKAVADKIKSSFEAALPGKYEILKMDSVGAVISSEVQKSALIALALGILGLLTYIAFRFELAYGLGAVVAVFHDVIIALGIYLALGHEINGSVVAAALTILGYSVNDTIVIFDRVREELRKRSRADLATVMNESMNFCLSRTLVTGGLTLMAALSLLFLGGGAIQDLSLFLVVGVIVGAYSTIYIASPVVLLYQNIRKTEY
jgi:preprotein translocase subunit SecF